MSLKHQRNHPWTVSSPSQLLQVHRWLQWHIDVTRHLWGAILFHVFHFERFWGFFNLKFELIVFCPWLCSQRNVRELVCKIGKFTTRDANSVSQKFCIFNKEYFVFLAHCMFGCQSLFGGVSVSVCFPSSSICLQKVWLQGCFHILCSSLHQVPSWWNTLDLFWIKKILQLFICKKLIN